MKMKLYDYLTQNLRNVFWPWELNHVIGFTYSGILAASKDESDRIEVSSYRISWFNAQGEIGSRQLNSNVWRIDFIDCLTKFSNGTK
jgi:hypothetical protein